MGVNKWNRIESLPDNFQLNVFFPFAMMNLVGIRAMEYEPRRS